MSNYDDEVWKPIVGYEDYYAVSSYGRVWSYARIVKCKNGRAKHRKGRMLKLNYSTGYPHVVLCVDSIHYSVNVHSIVTEAFLGPRPANHVVCHNDSDKANCHVSNLRYDTESANHLDCYKIADKFPTATIKPTDVMRIIELHETGMSYQKISKLYGVAKTTIGAICRKESFYWLHDPEMAERVLKPLGYYQK